MYRLTVLKNMKAKVNRTIETVETVETEVEFPKYTRDDFSYCKHYSEDHCVAINIVGDTFASVFVTHNNKFTKGETYVGASLSAVVILTGKKTGADADLNELLNDVPDVPETKFKTAEELLGGEEKNDLPF